MPDQRARRTSLFAKYITPFLKIDIFYAGFTNRYRTDDSVQKFDFHRFIYDEHMRGRESARAKEKNAIPKLYRFIKVMA